MLELTLDHVDHILVAKLFPLSLLSIVDQFDISIMNVFHDQKLGKSDAGCKAHGRRCRKKSGSTP